MIRDLLILGGALAIAGAAHAQSTSIKVSLLGKSDRQVRSELYQAAVSTCRASLGAQDEPSSLGLCVTDTYSDALIQANRFKHRAAVLARVASR